MKNRLNGRMSSNLPFVVSKHYSLHFEITRGKETERESHKTRRGSYRKDLYTVRKSKERRVRKCWCFYTFFSCKNRVLVTVKLQFIA